MKKSEALDKLKKCMALAIASGEINVFLTKGKAIPQFNYVFYERMLYHIENEYNIHKWEEEE